MHAPDDSTTPAPSVMRRLVTPWEYRHLHAAGGVRLAGGGFNLGVGAVLLSLGRRASTSRERRKCYGWAAWFLTHGTLLLVGGVIDMTLARSAPPRT
jgi:hypothetical protein